MRVALAAFVIPLLAPRAAHAYAYEGIRWPIRELPLQYTVGPSCRDFADQETVDLVNRVFQRWEDVDCAHISFEYIGRGADFGLGAGGFGYLGDGYNNVSWCRSCLGGNALGVAVLAPSREENGLFAECDEYMEDNYEFTLDHDLAAENGFYIDAEAVTAQESGHCLGLAHTDVQRATMYPQYIPYWEMWTPDADDIEGLCWIYPMEDGCRSHDECRAGTSCIENVCLPLPPPPREFGWPCVDASECLSGYCAIDPATDDNICTEECDLANPVCPDGGTCRRLGPCAEAACFPTQPGDGALETECTQDTECSSGLCDEGHCRVPCLFSSDGPCPAGTGCWPVAECGACRPGDPPAPVGAPCDSNEDCPGRVCAFLEGDRICTQVCDDPTSCPAGTSCVDVEGTSYCVPDGAALGDSCGGNDDCASGICAHVGSDDYCTRVCDAVECPSGWECVDASGYQICSKKAKSGGCATGGRGSPSPIGVAIAIFALAWSRRRR